MDKYDHKKIEPRWQKEWSSKKIYETPDEKSGRNNFYLLTEFPYPSGNLHVGHWYAFALPDIFARFKRMNGCNVLYPVGFDAFGLPAENAAIKRGLNPRKWTEENIEYMTGQLKTMGASFDWSRKIATIDPDYYKWTQWMFLKFFEKGLAEQKKTEVNWCDSCKTVLANEQVVNGRCERCDSDVVKKKMNQWNLKITDYADRLLEDLENLDWPEEIKTAQRNWIGKSEGAEIEFEIIGAGKKIKVFTTRPDTILGVTYMVLAPEHDLVLELKDQIENWSEVDNYINESRKKSEIERQNLSKEKTGVELKGVLVKNPANEEKIPVYIADYVLSSYGTGAIMAVPAHDERDEEFAKKFYLPIGNGELMDFDEAIKVSGGKKTSNYRLRDWTVSRQRYWGVPIPIIHCEKCGAVAVSEKELPVELPEIEDYLPRDDGKSPLAKAQDWVKIKCPNCNGDAERETDTLDTFVDSSWYYLRYTDPKNKKEFAEKSKQNNWMPVNLYSGGSEHTTMHLLYSRFWHKVLFDLNLVSDPEPYKRRMNRGLILGPDGNKMSKSKGNVIDPDEVVERLGADTVRLYLSFVGPFNEMGSYPWSPDGVVGVRRFLEKVWRMQEKIVKEGVDSRHSSLLHKTVKKVTEDVEKLSYNTAISAMMILANNLEKEDKIPHKEYTTLLALLAPFAPHITEELWHRTGHKESVHLENWPEYDKDKVADDKVIVAVQVNGKVRGEIEINKDDQEEEIKTRALASIAKWLDSKEPEKVIYVPGKIVSVVV